MSHPETPSPCVVAVHASPGHRFSKPARTEIQLLTGLGVEGDAHCGATVKHRSRVAHDPSQPNLRQIHLIHRELLDALAAAGHLVAPGDLGENITTAGIALLDLPVHTQLAFPSGARITLTGLRNPCAQIDHFQSGLLAKVLERRPDGSVVRKAGVMGIVRAGGRVCPGDAITLQLPPPPHQPLHWV